MTALARLYPVIPTEPQASGGISLGRAKAHLSFALRGTRSRWALLGRLPGSGTTGDEEIELVRRWPLSTVRRGMAPNEAVMTRRRCGQDASDVTVASVTTWMARPFHKTMIRIVAEGSRQRCVES